jgi:hypothetical protein
VAAAVKSRGSESTIVTANRSGDESAGLPVGEDHGSSAADVVARGGTSVAVTPGPSPTALPAFASRDPEVLATGQPDEPRVVDRAFGHEPDRVAAGRAARAEGRDHRVDLETLRFRGADVLASCSPYERGALERAIDRFLEQLSGPDAGMLRGMVPASNLVPGVVVVAGALLAMETLRRRTRRDRDDAATDDQAEGVPHSGFPGVPGRRRIWALEDR